MEELFLTLVAWVREHPGYAAQSAMIAYVVIVGGAQVGIDLARRLGPGPAQSVDRVESPDPDPDPERELPVGSEPARWQIRRIQGGDIASTWNFRNPIVAIRFGVLQARSPHRIELWEDGQVKKVWNDG